MSFTLYKKKSRLGGNASHERVMLSNLASELLKYKRISTTEARAKRLRPYIEKLITFAKKDTLSSRRHILKYITNKKIVYKLFSEVIENFKNRPGGYTRIVKLKYRKGDNARIVSIELIDFNDYN